MVVTVSMHCCFVLSYDINVWYLVSFAMGMCVFAALSKNCCQVDGWFWFVFAMVFVVVDLWYHYAVYDGYCNRVNSVTSWFKFYRFC